MATIKQITKQIETANKRIADFGKRIAMYTNRMNKAIDNLNRMGADIAADNITMTETKSGKYTLRDFTLPRDIMDSFKWSDTYKVIDNRRMLDENERNLDRENKHLSSLIAQRKQMMADEQEHYHATAGLATALEQAMADFRVEWFNRMNDWHVRHYAHIQNRMFECRDRRNRAERIRNYFTRTRGWMWTTGTTAKYLSNVIKCANDVLLDDAARMSFDEYMEQAKAAMLQSWEHGIHTLTDKCHTFGLNEQAIRVDNPTMTEKGFAAHITDGTTRVVHVRVIWAAEYSVLVTPHTRYIATQRTR